MKLITEVTEQVKYITEEGSEGGKSLYIVGPFLQGNVTNRNKRYYDSSILEKEVNRYVKENVDNRPDEFYSHINELINYEYGDMDPRDAIDVLENIISSLRARQHREKTGSKFINKDDVMKNWNMNEEIATPKGGLSRKMYTLYNKEKIPVPKYFSVFYKCFIKTKILIKFVALFLPKNSL